MHRTTILALTILSCGLLPLACARNFNFFASSAGTGASASGGSSTSSSTASSSSGTGGAGGGGCTMDAQCDDMNSCTADICDSPTGTCSHTNVPDGMVPGYVDTVKDCKTEMCAAGVEVSVADDTDVPPSPSPCVTNSCSMMNVVMTDVASGMPCGGTQKCDGAGNCVGCNMDGDCPNPGTCQGVTCMISTHTCVVAPQAPETACTGAGGAKFCDGAGNCVVCVGNGDCASGNCMANHTCGAAANGHACTGTGTNPACMSNHCANGVCCNTACAGACTACTKALTGTLNDGTCGPVKVGTDPVPASQCTAAPPCADGTCNGAGACTAAAVTTPCGTASCDAGTEMPTGLCSGTGTCVAGASMGCGMYACNGAVCGVQCANDSECASGNYCVTLSHTCTATLASGVVCTASDQCTSGMCVPPEAGILTICN